LAKINKNLPQPARSSLLSHTCEAILAREGSSLKKLLRRIQGFKDSRVQGFKGSRIQGFKGLSFED
jgi:hypothetical protein